MDGLMPIGEFSVRSGLSANRLRTYAAGGLLVPAAVDPASGYRYYSPEQLPAAQLVDALRQAGVPLVDIGTFLGRPSRQQLDAWAERMESEATHRREALAFARQLVAKEDAPALHRTNSEAKEGSMTTLHTAGRTEKGPVRENNEDAVVTSERLAVIADGMGGPPGGEVASRVAAGVVRAAFTGRTADELESTVRAANWAIWDRAAAHPELEGMGTTVCAVGLLEDGDVVLANVGDTRAYLWCEGTLRQVTRDHSVTAELVQRGELRVEEARAHPHYGILTRVLGVGPDVDIDCRTLAVETGDRLVLCSDGLFNELSDDEIASVLGRRGELGSVVDDLIDEAIERGGRDNVSVVVAEIAA